MRTKAHLYAERMSGLRRQSQGKPSVNHAELLKLRPIDRVAELMSLEYDNEEIANLLGYNSARSVNGVIQRMRGQIGWQAV